MFPIRRSMNFDDMDENLLQAIRCRDLTKLKYLLQFHRSRSLINQTFFFRSHRNDLNHPLTLLAAACHYGSYEIVDVLINDFNANVNYQHFPHCQTSLHHGVVAKSNRLEIVRFLLRHGAQVDLQDRHGTTPLMLAVLHSDHDVVHLLLEQAGANVRIYNQYHLTAFDFLKSNLSIFADLIRFGALIDNKNLNRIQLFQWLILNKHRRFARLFIEAGFTPPINSTTTSFSSRFRSLKSFCRLKIRRSVSGASFRQQIQSLPVNDRSLIKYLLLDEFFCT